jgi:hypothetical protein
MNIPVHGSSRSPASTAAVERAVAEVTAAGANPVRVGSDFIDIFPISHVKTVSTEVSKKALTLGAGGALAQGLLTALVAGHSINLVIHLKERRNASIHNNCRWQPCQGDSIVHMASGNADLV